MNKKKIPAANIGTSSIITIFVILCMVAFSMLSYMNAKKDADFNNQLMLQNDDYYAASSAAYQQIADIDETLQEAYLAGSLDDLDPIYQISVPVDDKHTLEVELTVRTPDQDNGALYTITRFQEVSTQTWESDDSLNLIQIP
ncbi:MAG: hypothetical protein EOM40_05620 [Clostridia bacterium]|nr:hypothetical protein [Clostridia bacterium]NCC42568.1 hypothetical protein [Clostridia bacterium]